MATLRRYLATAVLPLVFAAAACGGPSDTEGSQGHARFAYVYPCVWGCALDHAMMVGTSEDITAKPNPGGGLPGLTATTDDPSVASVESTSRQCVTFQPGVTSYAPGDLRTPCTPRQDTGWVVVAARNPGKTALRLLRLDGTTFDSVVLEVAAPARLGIKCNSSAALSSLNMKVGQTCGLEPVAFDAKGDPLRASRGIQVAITNPWVVTFNGFQDILTQQLVAIGRGESLLVASTGGLRAEVLVHVTDDRLR